MSDGGAEQLEVAPPVMSAAEHMANVCTLAAGMMAGTRLQPESIGEDAIIVYHRVIDAYVADGGFPVT